MQVLPVLDLRHGQVVHAIAGQRSDYRPLRSRLTASTDPVEVARCLQDACGTSRVYVADLDAILDDSPAWSLIAELFASGHEIFGDLGIRDARRARDALDAGAYRVIVGLETCRSPGLLTEIIETVGANRVTFSLDLQNGCPLSGGWDWPNSPLDIARIARSSGVASLIVLDLGAVGVQEGASTIGLCQQLRETPGFEDIELITGGGVRNEKDLRELARIPVEFALVSTAIHRGSLTAADLHRWNREAGGQE